MNSRQECREEEGEDGRWSHVTPCGALRNLMRSVDRSKEWSGRFNEPERDKGKASADSVEGLTLTPSLHAAEKIEQVSPLR